MSPSSKSPPPMYAAESPSVQWRLSNAKYKSVFTVDVEPTVEDFRAHTECIKGAYIDDIVSKLRCAFGLTGS